MIAFDWHRLVAIFRNSAAVESIAKPPSRLEIEILSAAASDGGIIHVTIYDSLPMIHAGGQSFASTIERMYFNALLRLCKRGFIDQQDDETLVLNAKGFEAARQLESLSIAQSQG